MYFMLEYNCKVMTNEGIGEKPTVGTVRVESAYLDIFLLQTKTTFVVLLLILLAY